MHEVMSTEPSSKNCAPKAWAVHSQPCVRPKIPSAKHTDAPQSKSESAAASCSPTLSTPLFARSLPRRSTSTYDEPSSESDPEMDAVHCSSVWNHMARTRGSRGAPDWSPRVRVASKNQG